MPKIKKTFSVDVNIVRSFENECNKSAISQSKLIEKLMLNWIAEKQA